MRKTALTLAGLVMIGSLQVLMPVITPSTPPEKPQSEIAHPAASTSPESQTSIARDEDSPAEALCNYFRTQPDNAPWLETQQLAELKDKVVFVRKPVTLGTNPNQFDCVTEKYKSGAEFLISTVPDPMNSHLALEYDRSMESIERAAADAGYTFDRYWLPWNDAYIKPQKDLETARDIERQRRLREEKPGALIFHRQRHDYDSPELLIIFLVGETPSFGLNKAALWNAINYIRDLQNKYLQTEMGILSPIKIAGPNLSASLHSMAVLFRDVQGNANGQQLPPLSIISGSVSNCEAIDEFKQVVRTISETSGVPITFHTLTNDDSLQRAPILTELERITGASPSELGVISETASGYSGHTRADSPTKTGCTDDSHGVLQLSFPRDIAPLRNAYQAVQDSLAAAKSKQANPLPQVSLPMSYGEGETHERDNVPALAQSQSPVSQDTIMQQIVQTLRQRKTKAVVVYATSTLDTLFLLHYLREFTPDIRVALPASDLLYIRSGEPKDFTGAIVFSDYPLFVLDKVQNKFASSLAESHYFAVRASLGPGQVYEKASTPDHPFPKRQFWMGVVGKNAYWPVRFPVQPDKLLGAPPLSFKAEIFSTPAPSWFWYVFIVLINAAAAVHCWAVITASRSQCDKRWWWEYYAIDHGQDDKEQKEEYRQARGCYLLLATINVAIAQFVVLAPSWRLHQETHQKPLLWLCWLSLIMFLCSIYVIGFAAKAAFIKHRFASDQNDDELRKQELRKQHDRIERSSHWIAVICLASFLGVLLSWRGLSFGSDGLYFSYRSVFLLSGVCPALPALFVAAGIYTYAMGSMRRVTYLQNRFASFPNGFDCILHTDFKRLQVELDRSLTPVTFISFSKEWWVPIMVFMVIVGLGLLRAGPHSIEGASYDAIMIVGIYAVWAALLSTVLRFWHVWEVANRMLRRLERQPLRHAFNRIPGLFSWTPIWKIGGIKRSMLVQARSLEYLRCLKGEYAVHNDALENELLVHGEDVAKVEKELNAVLKLETTGQRITHEVWRRLDDALCGMATKLMENGLINTWREGGADSASKDWDIRRKDLPKGPGWRSDKDHRVMLAAEFVALKFVAVIRYISLQMRNMMAMMSFGFVLLVLALESYPFQPRERISWWILASFVALSASVLFVFRGLSNDLVLKRLTATRPGKVETTFLWPALKFGVLPILTVLASQFPALSSFLFSWLEPALGAVH